MLVHPPSPSMASIFSPDRYLSAICPVASIRRRTDSLVCQLLIRPSVPSTITGCPDTLRVCRGPDCARAPDLWLTWSVSLHRRAPFHVGRGSLVPLRIGSSSRTSWPEALSAPGSEHTGPPDSSPEPSCRVIAELLGLIAACSLSPISSPSTPEHSRWPTNRTRHRSRRHHRRRGSLMGVAQPVETWAGQAVPEKPWSSNTRSQPPSRRASTCRFERWSVLDTLA